MPLLAVLLFCQLFAPGPAAAQGASLGQSFDVQVVDVDAAALLTLVAHGAGNNLIVGPSVPRKRIDLNGIFESAAALAEAIARDNGWSLLRDGRIHLLLRAGCASSGLAPPSGGDDQSMSIYAQEVGLDAFSSSNGLPRLSASDATAATQRRVSVAIHQASRREVLGALAAVAVECAGAPDTEISPSQEPADWPIDCPHKMPSGDGGGAHRCAPLEFYGLNSLLPKGYIRINKKNYWSLVESPDGVLHLVRNGDRLGRRYGSVQAISPRGIRIKEFTIEAKGDFQEVVSVLGFGVHPQVKPNLWSSSIEDGSELDKYYRAVAALWSAVWFPAEVVQVCRRRHPQEALWMEKALAGWSDRNKVAIDEINKHYGVYIGQLSEDLLKAPAVHDQEFRGLLKKRAYELIPVQDARSIDYCKDYLVALEKPGNKLDVKHRAYFETIRSCLSRMTCPVLRKK